jgi:hypothetical protein
VLVAFAALVALWRFQIAVIPVIAACAAIGSILWLIGGVR